MVLPKNPSWWQLVLYLVALPLEAVIGFVNAVFFPVKKTQDSQSVFVWYDEAGNRHVHLVYKGDKRR